MMIKIDYAHFLNLIKLRIEFISATITWLSMLRSLQMNTFRSELNKVMCSSCEFESILVFCVMHAIIFFSLNQHHSANSLIGVTAISIPKSPESGKFVEDILHL